MDSLERGWYRKSASRITVAAHLFGVAAIILLLVWLVHYRGGIDLDSYNSDHIFNVHPFLMFFGFIFFAGEAMMAYKTIPAERKVQKFAHMFMHVIAICLGIVGIHAAFKFHDRQSLTHMYSLHSWIGLSTFILFCLQWLFGFGLFMFSRSTSSMTRMTAMPWHVSAGRALLYMAICTAETGLMQAALGLRDPKSRESRLINFLGLFVLLFGIAVDISVALARYV